jgi:aminopeptidase YwaD
MTFIEFPKIPDPSDFYPKRRFRPVFFPYISGGNSTAFNMIRLLLFTAAALAFSPCAFSQTMPLLPDSVIGAMNSELSGESAKRNLEFITRLHRVRGSAEFKMAIDFITPKLLGYGLTQIEPIRIAADGRTMYGTQKSRLAWDAEFAELWELEKTGNRWTPKVRIADWESMPVTLAEDSESGDVITELIDVGAGTSEKDYAGKNVRGQLVLTSSPPDAVAPLAVEKVGAAGIISYAQNQPTAWSKEDQNLIRWGHLNSFATVNTFCFMVSLNQAREFRERLLRGEKIMLHATVRAGRHTGTYSLVTAIIPGSDPLLKNEEIAFTCHLDHQRPGANDNASGSVTILEVARTLSTLIAEGRIQKPRRTIRFIWSPEIEGTSALLHTRPEYASNIKAVIHLDMVGGAPVTKSVFHVAGGPRSLPTFVPDVGEAFGEFVNEQSDAYASGYPFSYPFVSQEGGREPLLAILGQFHMGSDHDIYNEGSFKIPCVYLHDWPDRYIHTNGDVAANIDPTKLKRASFIAAASGYFLATMAPDAVPDLWRVIRQHALTRVAEMIGKCAQLPESETGNLRAQEMAYERGVFQSIQHFVAVPATVDQEADTFYKHLGELAGEKPVPSPGATGSIVYRRNPEIKGPLTVFGYDYLSAHYGADKFRALRLPDFSGLWGNDYAYEALNFVDGKRSALDIRNALAAEFGPISYDVVAEYLRALENIGVIQTTR